MRLLIVEDELSLQTLLATRLSKFCTIDSCSNGLEALFQIRKNEYNLVLLDLNLPRLDGLALLNRIRSEGIQTPVIVMSARGTTKDIVDALDAGANDYLVKPFSYEELRARIRTILRTRENVVQNTLQINDLSIDLQKHHVMRGDHTIILSAKEYQLLEYMMLHSNTILSHEQLARNVWGGSLCSDSNAITVYISFLRKKIDDLSDIKLIHTIHGVGYMLGQII